MWVERRNEVIAFGIAAAVLGWAVLAFGSAMDIVVSGDVTITSSEVVYEENVEWPVRKIAVISQSNQFTKVYIYSGILKVLMPTTSAEKIMIKIINSSKILLLRRRKNCCCRD